MFGTHGSSVAAACRTALALAATLLAVSGCGQKGPLFIPGVERPEGGVARQALPASAPAASPASAAAAPPGVPLPVPAKPVSSPTSSTPSLGR